MSSKFSWERMAKKKNDRDEQVRLIFNIVCPQADEEYEDRRRFIVNGTSSKDVLQLAYQ